MGSTTSQIMEKIKELLSVFRTENQISLTILGLDSSGKTTLVNLLNGTEMPTIPTLGFNHDEVKIDKTTIRLWDVGGQKALIHFWADYVKSTDGLVYVIDIADKQRFVEAFNAFKVLVPHLKENIPVLILLNKIDLIKDTEVIDSEKEFIAKTFGCDSNSKSIGGQMSVESRQYRSKILECSVLDCQNEIKATQSKSLADTNIYAGFKWVMKIADGHNEVL